MSGSRILSVFCWILYINWYLPGLLADLFQLSKGFFLDFPWLSGPCLTAITGLSLLVSAVLEAAMYSLQQNSLNGELFECPRTLI